MWPRVYVSDEWVGFAMDSAFIASFGLTEVEIEVARRADVTTAPDVVIGGALLVEPTSVERIGQGRLEQAIRFASTADFAGEYLYRLRYGPLRGWEVVEFSILWIT